MTLPVADPTPEKRARLSALRPALEQGDADALDRLQTLAYADGWVRTDFDWVAWAATDGARALLEDPSAATLPQVSWLLTLVVRQERFVEGSLDALVETGWLGGLLRRVDDLAAAYGHDVRR